MEEIQKKLEDVVQDVKKITICDLIKIKIFSTIKEWKRYRPKI